MHAPSPSGPVHQLSGDLLVRDGEAPQLPELVIPRSRVSYRSVSSIPFPSGFAVVHVEGRLQILDLA